MPNLGSCPDDLFWVLFQTLGCGCAFAFTVCSRRTYRIGRAAFGPPQPLGSIQLSPAQAWLAARARETPSAGGFRVIRAPPGFGKTATAIAVARPGGRPAPGLRWAVFVPPKALMTWKAELSKLFGQAIFAEPGGALVLHSAARGHRERFAATRGTPAEPSLVVATWPTAEHLRLDAHETIGSWANRFILDEAHTAPTRLIEALAAKDHWVLCVSASRVHFARGLPPPRLELGGAGLEWLGGRCPELALRRESFEPAPEEAQTLAPVCKRYALVVNQTDEYLRAIRRAFVRIEGPAQVALFLPDGQTGKHIADILAGTFRLGGWETVVFVKAVSKLRRFARQRRSVLLIRHSQSEALNVVASHAIVVRPDWVNVGRYDQILGRVLRPTNPAARVEVTLVYPEGVAAHRVAFYNAARDPAADEAWWPRPRKTKAGLVFDRPDASDLLRAASALQLCGSRLDRASAPEVAAALGASYTGGAALAEGIFAAWRTTPGATLAEGQVCMLLGLDPLGSPRAAGPRRRPDPEAGVAPACRAREAPEPRDPPSQAALIDELLSDLGLA